MKKFLLALLGAVPLFAMAAGNDLFQDQRNPANTGTQTRTVTVPNADAIQGFAFTAAVPGNRVPVMFTLGAGLTLTGTVLSATPGAVDWPTITNKPTAFTPSAHTHAAADIVSGTLAPARLPALAISQTTGLQTALDGKFNTPTGSQAQYVRGDGSLATLPIGKRIETYTGTTNAAGQIVVSYPTPYASVPSVQPGPPVLANQMWAVVSSTAAGFTLQLSQRNVVTLLGLEVLLGATVPVNGAAAQVLVVGQ